MASAEDSSDTMAGTDSLQDSAVRIFVAGDRMSVGKTSVCTGILGSLIASGYDPKSLAYIKPATQNEDPQLIAHYCETVGIECVSVGPIVYYRGFTRAFLAGETESTEYLLSRVSHDVDLLCRSKKVVVIDGVGFPAVGSICGTDNASVARACGYPSSAANSEQRSPPGVVIVGGSGVGAAVDAYNLNATYFLYRKIPVMGVIFNKLSLEGFYSLENCKEQITRYFSQYQEEGAAPFGFVPMFEELSVQTLDEFLTTFRKHVDVSAIIDKATSIKELSGMIKSHDKDTAVRGKISAATMPLLDRHQIEQAAIKAGAAPSA